MAKAIPFGLDGGNGSLKGWSSAMLEGILIPSVFYKLGIDNDVEDNLDHTDYTPENIVDNLDITYVSTKALDETNQRYYIGNRVAKEFKDGSETTTESIKYIDKTPILVGLAALAVDAIKRNPEKTKIKINYDLGLALPVLDISTGAKIQEERFMGTHELIVHQPSGNNIQLTITVEFASCIPEGAAAAWGVVYDEKGRANKRKYLENDVVKIGDFRDLPMTHADIGGGSTELVYTEGIQYYHKQSDGLPFGTKQIIVEINKDWNKTRRQGRLKTVNDFTKVYFDNTDPRHAELNLFAKSRLDRQGDKIGREIVNFYNGFSSASTALPLIIYGGGAILFKDSISKVLEQNGLLDKVVFLEDALFTNAKGLLVYCSSPVFAKKKEAALGVA